MNNTTYHLGLNNNYVLPCVIVVVAVVSVDVPVVVLEQHTLLDNSLGGVNNTVVGLDTSVLPALLLTGPLRLCNIAVIGVVPPINLFCIAVINYFHYSLHKNAFKIINN